MMGSNVFYTEVFNNASDNVKFIEKAEFED